MTYVLRKWPSRDVGYLQARGARSAVLCFAEDGEGIRGSGSFRPIYGISSLDSTKCVRSIMRRPCPEC